MKKISIKKEGNSTLIGALVPIGSRDEPNKIKGISHFVEHMLFKGTTNRTKEQIKSINFRNTTIYPNYRISNHH